MQTRGVLLVILIGLLLTCCGGCPLMQHAIRTQKGEQAMARCEVLAQSKFGHLNQPIQFNDWTVVRNLDDPDILGRSWIFHGYGRIGDDPFECLISYDRDGQIQTEVIETDPSRFLRQP